MMARGNVRKVSVEPVRAQRLCWIVGFGRERKADVLGEGVVVAQFLVPTKLGVIESERARTGGAGIVVVVLGIVGCGPRWWWVAPWASLA